MYRKQVKQGETIFGYEQPGDSAFLVESGQVRILDKITQKDSYLLGPGDMFGEYGVIAGASHYSAAVAEEDCLLLVVSREEIEEKTNSADPMISLFLKFFMERCHDLTKRHHGVPVTPQDQPAPLPHRRDIALRSHREQLLKEFQIKEELERALLNDEMVLYFQPIISLRGGFTAGFEALLRWQHPTRGLLSPYHFIDIAETTNMIVPIGDWVFREACKQARDFNLKTAELGKPEVFVSINISANQFAVPNISRRFKEITEETGADVSTIELEITESVLMEDTAHAKKVLGEVKELGFDLVLDDFGTGYSSLNYLHQFPIDKLKIDRSFTHTVLTDESSLEIVRAISGLAHNLNIEVVAEGIEEREQLSLYRDLDCHFGQGYLISKPLSVQDVYGILGTRMSI
ncbi:EAL domain-containing protein [Sneathiella chinensis]|uniref:EAL domain-containing protein n=1 Tax=Sneathiella chinensis TaxID=349750 RepID=UPI00146D5A86|nr:EAL domain-containing protein [Sneathiella chinensis]